MSSNLNYEKWNNTARSKGPGKTPFRFWAIRFLRFDQIDRLGATQSDRMKRNEMETEQICDLCTPRSSLGQRTLSRYIQYNIWQGAGDLAYPVYPVAGHPRDSSAVDPDQPSSHPSLLRQLYCLQTLIGNRHTQVYNYQLCEKTQLFWDNIWDCF